MTPEWSFRNKRLLIVGPSASGKTTYALDAIAGFAGPRLIFDQKGEFADRLKAVSSSCPRECLHALRVGRPVCFNPHAVFPGRTADGFAWFAAWSFAMAREMPGEKLFVVDEVHHFTGTGAGQLPVGIRMILETGRCYKLHSLAISHGANLVNNRLRNQFSHVVAFATRERNALDFLRDCGLDEESITALPRFAFLQRDLEGGTGNQTGRIVWRGNRASVQLRASEPASPGRAKTLPVPAASGG